jgi:DNA-binding winged helix-turn-helix (wHTH) protein
LRYLFEDYCLDTNRRELWRGGAVVRLEPQVFDLLAYLMRERERVVSKDDLMASVWDGRIVSESALTTRINAAHRYWGQRKATAPDQDRAPQGHPFRRHGARRK